MGHDVTVFEAFHAAGGVLVYGIPEFRLPKEIVAREVERLVGEGVKIETNAIIGKTFTLPRAARAVRRGLHRRRRGTAGVHERPRREPQGRLLGQRVPHPGQPDGGLRTAARTRRSCTASGSRSSAAATSRWTRVRTARRLGADEAIIVYRRGRDELPARAEEVHHAEEEGVRFELLTAPLEVLGDEDGWVRGLRCIRMELGEPDASGRRRPEPIPGSEFEIPCDMVVVAIGTRSNPLLTATAPDLEVNQWGYIEIDETGMTSMPGVFAGGDIVRGAATVILAMGDGKRAAGAIDRYLRGEPPEPVAETAAKRRRAKPTTAAKPAV